MIDDPIGNFPPYYCTGGLSPSLATSAHPASGAPAHRQPGAGVMATQDQEQRLTLRAKGGLAGRGRSYSMV